jgi:Asp-tRNA(Asn)/Glu-tRNA(Gln) amidotransferase A subunit family amidase
MTDACDLTATDARRLIGVKELSPVELLESCIARIEAVDPAVNAMVTTCFDRARAEAKAAERAVRSGDDLGVLHGLPVGIKDLSATEGVRTTYGSLLYEDHVPDADERSVAAIRAQGGIVVGKTNTPEFGAGANTTNRVFGATGNPFDPALTCGGSSGGSAVVVATGSVPLASGSDFGGSLRTPATFCGVVGYRPSPGIVPNETRPVGLTPLSVQGAMARTVADAALLLSAMADVDMRDPFSGLLDEDLLRPPEPVDLGSLRAAFSEDLGCAPVDRGIRKVFRERTARFRAAFADAQDRDPDLGPVHDVFEILRGVNFIAAHKERLENHRDKLGPNVIDNTERGLRYGAADVAWAHVEQTRLYRRFLAMFDEVDVLICPAASVSPFPHDQLYISEINGETLPTYMRWLAITYGVTMATPPVAVIPCGVDHAGMPFGIQVVGANGNDRFVLDVAHSLEQVLARDPATARPVPDRHKLEKSAGKKAALG